MNNNDSQTAVLDIDGWMEKFRRKLTDLFGERVLFLGLQGSYGRGEATSTSDIDVVVILDRVSFEDLQAYRAMLDTMDRCELICGFVAGKEELEQWEKSDLLQLLLDTRPIIGSLDSLWARISTEDIRRAVLTGACNLYHACSHNFLHAKDIAVLASLYKAARFTVRMKHYLETGEYVASMHQLASHSIPPSDQAILNAADKICDMVSNSPDATDSNSKDFTDNHSLNTSDTALKDYSCQLLEWTSELIRQSQPKD